MLLADRDISLGFDGSHLVRGRATVPTRSADRIGTMTEATAADWAHLMARIRDHADQSAFAQLFGYYAPKVKAYLIRSGSDHATAEECMQEVMATVWNKAKYFDPARASVATWIFTIARNRRIDIIRKERRPEPEDITWTETNEPDQADVYEMQQQADILGRALQELPDKQRHLIERAFFGDLSHSEIASETGLPLGTIKSRIRLALDRLRHSMSKTQ